MIDPTLGPTPEPTIDPLPNGGEWFPGEGDPFAAPEPTAEAEPAADAWCEEHGHPAGRSV